MPTKTFRCLLGLLTFSLGGLCVLGGWSRSTWAQSTPSASVAQQETTAATPLESTSAAPAPGDADAQSAEEAPTYPPLAEKYLRAVEATFGDPPGMTRLDPHSRVWVDRQKKRLVVDGYIALNAGQLEMFACLVGTKEHESVVAVFSKALVVHAGLLAIGAEPGHPVRWEPQFEPPTGERDPGLCAVERQRRKEAPHRRTALGAAGGNRGQDVGEQLGFRRQFLLERSRYRQGSVHG
ncbi:MAG: hypothetical protein KatS3mg111_2669 [Pirellulaceae bacterium]|nr:MAG: hypothetical protein KatS3mg111_2669 [Pirellulaceae bacterium]